MVFEGFARRIDSERRDSDHRGLMVSISAPFVVDLAYAAADPRLRGALHGGHG
jgi:hypothetical protein